MAEPVSFEAQLECFQPNDQQLKSIRKDGSLSGVDLEGAANILDVYHRLENTLPQEAPTIIITMLRHAGFSEAQLESLEEYVRRVKKDKPQIPPSSNNQHQLTLGMLLVRLNPALNERQLKRVKLVVEVSGVSRSEIDTCKYVSEMYRLVEHKMPKKSVSWLILILSRVGVPETRLDSLKPYIEEAYHVEDDIMVDFILTLTDILENFTDEFYCSFRDLVIRTHLTEFHPDNLVCRTYLLHVLLERKLVFPDKLGHFFAWLEAIGCLKQHNSLREFCVRHRIVEPQWEHLVEPIRPQSLPEKILSIPKLMQSCSESADLSPGSYPQLTSHDGYKQGAGNQKKPPISPLTNSCSNESPRKEGAGSQKKLQNSPLTQAFSNQSRHEEDTTGKDTTNITDLSDIMGEYELQQASENQSGQSDTLVITHTSIPVNKLMALPNPVEERGRDGTAHTSSAHYQPEEVERDGVPKYSNSHIPLPRPESPQNKSNILCSVQLNSTPQPNSLLKSDSPRKQDPPPQHDSPPLHINDTPPDDINDTPPDDWETMEMLHAGDKNRSYSMDHIFCCCCSSIMILLIVVLFIGVIIFGIFKRNVFAPSSSTVAYIGGNTTNKIGCYDPAYIKRVTIAKGSKEDEYDTEIYKTFQNNFRYQIQTLKNKSDDTEEDFNNRKISINYYYGDYPVYVAHHGNLTYEVRGESLSKLSSHCPLEFYLFNNKGDYDTFINEEFGLPVHATKTSGCLPVNSTARNFTIQFSLDTPGFYFVGVSIIEHVHVSTTISGSIVEFNTSELSEQPCSLNYNDECTITITKLNVPSVTSQDPLVCVLVKSFNNEYHNINISVEFVDWNSVSVGFGSLSLLTLIVLVFVAMLFVFIFFMRKRKIAHHNNGYNRLPPS